MLTEDQVTNYVARHLQSQNFEIIKKLTSKEKGIDLIATSPDGKDYYIEVKGETSNVLTSKRYGLPFNKNQIWAHVSVAVMKTLTDINCSGKAGVFGMAFPKNHEDVIRWIKPSLDKLEIVVYLVSEDGGVILMK